MELAYLLGGGGPVVRKYRTDNDGGAFIAGIPVVSDEDTAASQGVRQGTTTNGLNLMGCSLDAVDDSQAAQNTDGSDNATHVTLCINPDAVWRAKLNDGATEDTALALATMASAGGGAGTDVSACDITVPDNSTVWGYSGANAGVVRQTSAANTFIVAMPRDIAAGDTFLFTEHIPGWENASPTLTTLLTQIDANTAGTTNKNFVIVEFELKDISDDGRNNSFALICAYDHAFAPSHLA